MRLMKATTTLILSFLVAGLGAGCASKTGSGAAIGAGTGAVLGGVIGHQSGEAKAGAAIGAAAGGLAGAAIGHEAERRDAAAARTPTDTGYVVREVPPMPTSYPRESIPPRPAREAVWIEGAYVYTGNPQTPYEWVSGHWEIPPPGMSRWVPATWQRSGDGYIFVRGHWH